MAVRPIALLALLTFTLVAGCSDGPPSGDVAAIAGALTFDGTAESAYVKAQRPYPGVPTVSPDGVCVPMAQDPVEPCVDPSSTYSFHFMSLPEPSGDGYAIFQTGGSVGERSLAVLAPAEGGMWQADVTKDEDQEGTFERFELRMGSFIVATASPAAGSQAFVADPSLSGVTVTATYSGKTLTLDVAGLPGDGSKPQFVGRLYTTDLSGNITVAESFNVVNGVQEYTSTEANIGDYVQFHIHVGTSKIYVYQGTI